MLYFVGARSFGGSVLPSFRQRLLIVAFSILVGMILFEGVKLLLPSNLSPWLTAITELLFVLLAAGIGLWIDARHSLSSSRITFPDQTDNTNFSSLSTSQQQHLEAELNQLNQELLSRSREHTNELARLNVELQLQMAMHQKAEEIAHLNEDRFRNMADNILEGLTILENGRLIYLNERACEIFGDCPDGDIFSRIQAFAAPDERPRLEQVIRQAQISGDIPHELEYWILSKDGARRCIRERYSISKIEEVTRTFIVTSDITEPVQAYQSLEHAISDRTRELSTVLDVSRRIASTLELEPLLNLILDQLQSIIPFTGAAIFTLEDDQLHAVAYQIPRVSNQLKPLHLSLERAGPYRQIISDQKVMIIDDIKGDSPLLRAIQESGSPVQFPSFAHAHSWIGIPLIARDQVTGLLSLTYSEPNYYTQRHARLALTIANQVAVAIENARLYEKSQNLAVIEERNRIARELHDSVTQLLYGICLYCTATSRSIRSGNPTQVEENLAEIKENALQALREMRLLILELNPPMLQKEGLVAALQASLEAIETRTGLETELITDGVHRLPRAVEAQLYRIAMEALNNLVRYAQAKKVTVDLRSGDDWIWMEISDNGVGFDVAKARASTGMGLQSMEQRAHQLKGRLEVISHPGSGTRILVEAPLYGLLAGTPSN
jgi:PAS domain S-box-containing protein